MRYGTLGLDETGPSFFFSTQFDKAETALRKYFLGLTSAVAHTLAGKAKSVLAGYVAIAKQKREPYDQNDLEDWIQHFATLKVSRGDVILFLSGFRKLRESGQIGDAVWNPAAWLDLHPEEKKSLEEKLTGAVQGLGKWVLIALGVVAFAYAAPGALSSYVAGRRK